MLDGISRLVCDIDALMVGIGPTGGLGGRALVPNNDCGGRRRLGLKMPWLAVDKLFTFFILLSALHLSRSLRSIPRSGPINYREEEKKILDSILGPEVYDKRIRPSGLNGTDAATIIVVNLYIRSFAKIDDVKMEYSVQITFRQKWNDERLSYDHRLSHGDMRSKIKYLTMTDARKVWMPDTFFRNEKEGRVSLTLACPMNLKLYPLDRQQCSLRVASCKYRTHTSFVCYSRMVGRQGIYNIFGKLWSRSKLSRTFTFPDSRLRNTSVITATLKLIQASEYSCLTVDLTFKREFSYYLLTIYVPCCMLVIVSWVSFWLDPNAVPARVSLGVTTLLTMSTQTASINNSLPPVAYTKAIDVWTGVCVTFVFSALLEYALVNYASRSDAQ
eukprot:TCALIF_04138-PA protein Name:"Similar to GluClalpha Glutamate-gated chloride channel (Drosophila melanogaster)" AED:0.22 eAED:0.34 QI:14/0/0/0.8/0.33/0.5/10/0/386